MTSVAKEGVVTGVALNDVCLVVPSVRRDSFESFYSRWSAAGLFDRVDLILVEDNPRPTFDVLASTRHTHLSWRDVEGELGGGSWVIPRRSDTVRSFGYLTAYRRGYRYIMTLDDDCYPTTDEDGLTYDGPGFVEEHLRMLTGRSRWFNTLNSVKPRGIPFFDVGNNYSIVLNHGLWTKVLDYDAPYQLANPIPEKFSFDSRLVPRGMYFPMCGMNLMWRRNVTVLMYHLLMGRGVQRDPTRNGESLMTVDSDGEPVPVIETLPFDRFGDIWCGIFAKKVLDLEGLNVSTGMPYIRHERASNPFTNLRKEANGIEVNERLWRYVDEFAPTPGVAGLTQIYRSLGEHVGRYDEFPEHASYFRRLGEAMSLWSALFDEATP